MTKRGYDKELTDVLRTAHLWYPDEPLFREIPIHVKYNRARIGDLKEGDRAPNPVLINLHTNKKESLYGEDSSKNNSLFGRRRNARKSNGIHVILAGSYS